MLITGSSSSASSEARTNYRKPPHQRSAREAPQQQPAVTLSWCSDLLSPQAVLKAAGSQSAEVHRGALPFDHGS